MQPHDPQYTNHWEFQYTPATYTPIMGMVPQWIHHTHDARAQRRNNAYLSQAVRHWGWDSQYMGSTEGVVGYDWTNGKAEWVKTPSMKIRKGNSKPKTKK
jgi:hypothetical protein